MAKLLVPKANPQVIKWAREGIGFDLEKAEERSKLQATIISDIETGKKIPTKAQLKKLAHAYKRPWALFLMPTLPSYIKKTPRWRIFYDAKHYEFSIRSLNIIRRAEDIRDIFYELEGDAEVSIVPKHVDQNRPEEASKILRESLGITIANQATWPEEGIFEQWRRVLERYKILILQGKVDLTEMRAFSIVDDNSPKVIFINKEDSKNARIFSLFHELGHIIIRDSSLCKMSDFSSYHARRAEVFCNEFAGSFLVPTDDLIKHPLVNGEFKAEWGDRELSILARGVFKVSREVVLRRLLSLNLASKEFYERKRAEWGRLPPPKKPFGRNKDSAARMAKTSINLNGFAFTSSVLNSVSVGSITLNVASDYLKLKPKYFSKLETVFNSYV